MHEREPEGSVGRRSERAPTPEDRRAAYNALFDELEGHRARKEAGEAERVLRAMCAYRVRARDAAERIAREVAELTARKQTLEENAAAWGERVDALEVADLGRLIERREEERAGELAIVRGRIFDEHDFVRVGRKDPKTEALVFEDGWYVAGERRGGEYVVRSAANPEEQLVVDLATLEAWNAAA